MIKFRPSAEKSVPEEAPLPHGLVVLDISDIQNAKPTPGSKKTPTCKAIAINWQTKNKP